MVFLNNEAFMLASGYKVNAIMGFNIKQQALAIYFDQFDVGSDFKSGRCRGLVANINMGADALFIGPVQMRINAQNTGPFQKPHQKPGGENLGHLDKFVRFRVKPGYGLGNRDNKLMAKNETGL